YLASMEEINTTVTSLFFNVLAAQMALEMAEKNYSSTELASKIAKERYEIGTISNSDLLQLRLRLFNDKLSISDNRLALETNILELRSYLGFNETVELELVLPRKGPDIQLDFDEVYTRATDNSSYTIDNELKILGAEQDVARAKSDVGLQAKFFAQFGLTQKGSNLSDTYSNPMDQEVIGLSLSLPIIDWGLGKGKIKLAKSREDVIRTQIEQAYFQYKQDILIKVLQFNKQSMQCSISAEADSIAQLRYNITLERFQNGTITVTDLNTAQSEKDNAAKRYISDLSNYWQYYFTIRKISLYDYINNRKVSADFDKMIDN
ncbi:MAG: TolC family protein, partial [Rikenellaceae bacterium]